MDEHDGTASDAARKGASLPQLGAVIDTLELISDQVRAYERVLPPDNHAARMAVAALGELARQALAEAQDLRDSFVPSPTASDHLLSPREHEVLTLAAQGLTNKEIAYRLGVSDRTVQFHMNSVFNKTATSSRTEAATLALQRGWIVIERPPVDMARDHPCAFGGSPGSQDRVS
jgi:DNA-binding NarL/FixJ family response regulator